MSIYKRKDSPYLWMCYIGANGKQIRESTECTQKGEARSILEKRKTDLKENKNPILRKDQKIKFANFANTFIDEYQGRRNELSENSRQNYKLLLKKINEYFGEMSLEQINDDCIDQYIKERKQATVKNRGGKKISKFTINRELGVLRLVLNWAQKKKKIVINPVSERLSSENLFREPARTRFFSDDEISALLANANEPMKNIILVAINAGMRLSEILGLRWDEVDINGKVINLPAERTKSKTGRPVPLNKTMIELFIQLKLKRQGGEFVFPNPKTGKPFNKSISHTWNRLLKKCGIRTPGRFHDLRRTFITRTAQRGASVKDIQILVGHKDPMTTMRVYLQATKTGMQRVADLANFSEPAGEIVELPEQVQKRS
ncbi:MAG: tyrosine-type recombinase/integrase [Candidatus Aminicenantes bacterium]|nr:tyrosine-type recombinase/integrase [Candidatus Aminicenantes bacterium]